MPAKIAAIECNHLFGGHRSCDRCARAAQRRVDRLGQQLVEKTAAALMRIEGFTGEPTPLTYLAAADLLDQIIPDIRRQLAP